MRVFLILLLALAVFAMEVRDWNDRPLSYGTAVVYDERGEPVALSYVINGALAYGLPWRPGYSLRVAWGVASLGEILSGRVIWVYDSQTARDVAELGYPTAGKVRTWVYPITITVRSKSGKPLAGCYAKILDAMTGGRWVSIFANTASDGSVSLFQAPATDYQVEIYCMGLLSATAKFSVQRGAPSTAWNYEITVDFIDRVKVRNAP
ncbi:hypothetical protein [Pyrobaculum aerophilum]|uniref:Carboxypeptidase regulatory-like domain-containing protein n=2 Tax=Pyrobaculum aerophilum TaxID=13773 RepID=Q8ZSQ6_PYRAE|nr:hypothetical protein [Pyrobaculum aerophilum]AAL65057.1 hypothetical protein PAE3630 [Pyrobaculum aerophilum str. IM2]MCX8137654.1 hypothetical protein [Pyrobaculum aerophilum]RFA95475.1 hypothetical protein CGL51_07685 [Pyrobaculum aerophilum]RFA97665.1 hypothetical protein CGL52_08695 [Pyrobaculum aerophilum]HII47814.1 hypothetical protein [Pyrobaculum aerophilum]